MKLIRQLAFMSTLLIVLVTWLTPAQGAEAITVFVQLQVDRVGKPITRKLGVSFSPGVSQAVREFVAKNKDYGLFRAFLEFVGYQFASQVMVDLARSGARVNAPVEFNASFYEVFICVNAVGCPPR